MSDYCEHQWRDEEEIDKLKTILDIIINNAVLQPDARMSGSTDCYAVPLDDIETARDILFGMAKKDDSA